MLLGQLYQAMRIPGVSSLSAVFKVDAQALSNAAKMLLHHGHTLLAELLIVDLLLGDARSGASGPFGLELEGLIADGKCVVGIGVLLLPQALGSLELSATDVAPRADGV
jgi:hypothetical protein